MQTKQSVDFKCIGMINTVCPISHLQLVRLTIHKWCNYHKSFVPATLRIDGNYRIWQRWKIKWSRKMTDYNEEMCMQWLIVYYVLAGKTLKVWPCFFILGEHLGTDIPGVFSLGDDKHSSLHHHGKGFTMTTLWHAHAQELRLWPEVKFIESDARNIVAGCNFLQVISMLCNVKGQQLANTSLQLCPDCNF